MNITAKDRATFAELRAPAWKNLNIERREVPSDEPWEVWDGELLTVNREPFAVPAELEHLSAEQLVELAVEHRIARFGREPAPVVAPAKPPRMTVGRALELLLESRANASAKASSCTVGRSPRGVVTWELTCTTDPDEVAQLPAAVDAVLAQHDRLAEAYPAPVEA